MHWKKDRYGCIAIGNLEKVEKDGTAKPHLLLTSDPTSSNRTCTVTASRVHSFHLACIEIIYLIAGKALFWLAPLKGYKKATVCKGSLTKRWPEKHIKARQKSSCKRMRPQQLCVHRFATRLKLRPCSTAPASFLSKTKNSRMFGEHTGA